MSHSQPHWAKNYSSSHNVYFDFPPVMNDGRNFSGWQPGNAVNESLRRAEGITTNWDYRRYLTTNADQIMNINRIDAVNASGHGSFEVGPYEQDQHRNVPFMYSSVMDTREPFGSIQSDLKDIYLLERSTSVAHGRPRNNARASSRISTPAETKPESIV